MKIKAKNPLVIFLVAAFLLEAAGYVVLPYLSLLLRERFKLAEISIGSYFLITTALRPIWSLLGSFLSRYFSTGYLIQIGAVISAISIGGLGYFTHPIAGFITLLFANAGLAIWNPSVYALAFQINSGSTDHKKSVSLLNFATYSGAAAGSGAASFLSLSNKSLIFTLSSAIFIFAAFLVFGVEREKIQHAKQTEKIEKKPFFKTLIDIFNEIRGPRISLICGAFFFWATYAQFNTFFSLYATDWLKNEAMVGISFAVLTVGVAFMSFVISRSQKLRENDLSISIGLVSILSLLWVVTCFFPNIENVILFLLTLGLSEAFMVLLLADLWAKQSSSKSHLMQSLNFSISTTGMAIGSFVGGLFYKAPLEGSLNRFGMENMILGLFSVVGLIGIKFQMNRNGQK